MSGYAPRKVSTEAELAALLPGSLVSTPFPDIEGNTAEKTVDGLWMIAGESDLYDSGELLEAADSDVLVIREGHQSDQAWIAAHGVPA